MKLPQSSRILHCVIAIAITSVCGCAMWGSSNEAIIRVQASRDPVKAKRLTLAGVKALDAQNIDGATQKFMSAINADETYGPAHNNLGLLHYEQGNLYQAVLAFEHAMEYMPSDPIVYYNLAITLEAAGKVHDAMDLYLQAVDMDPVNPVFLGNLVRLQIRLGETGPIVKTRLEDLVLIETRPDWRRWADHKLAIEFNDSLDRGPETPDFNPNGANDAKKVEFRIEDRVIELTPDRPGSASQSRTPRSDELKLNQPNFDLESERSETLRNIPSPDPQSHLPARSPVPANSTDHLRSTVQPKSTVQPIRDSRPIEITPPAYPSDESPRMMIQPDFFQN
ncbi:tetratricopeptide repeat protein [Rubripirellula amarantea]|nr:tetratricopeptide repeat protein [Rubripirellula amarantea]